jgi:drug/metabolite transporter superfamily protein YnfA
MRTIIITGTATPLKKGVKYDVHLYGQTEEHPVCIFITALELTCSCYPALVSKCKEKYTAYFQTHDFNIITLDNLHILPPQRVQHSKPATVRKIWQSLTSLRPEARTAIYHKYLKEHGLPKEGVEQKAKDLHLYLQQYKGTEAQFLFYLWYQTQYMHTRFPAGFTSWHQTYFLFSTYAEEMSLNQNSFVYAIANHGGIFAVADLAFEWTNTFEQKHKNTQWDVDLDFFDELSSFLQQREQFYKELQRA